MNDRRRTGVFDIVGAGLVVDAVGASGAPAPNAAVLGVGGTTSTAVGSPHGAVVKSH